MSKALGAVGRFLITAGIVVLLFVGYQLWGTGLQEAAAQDDLNSDFSALLAQIDANPTSSPTTSSGAPATTVATTVAPTTTVPEFGPIEVLDKELADALYRDGGEAIARLVIPAIDVTKVIVEGVEVEDLRKGPGHYRATALPGQEGNTGIAGHRTTYGAPFNRIDELIPGDEFTVETVQGIHVYRVMPASKAFNSALTPSRDFAIPAGDENLGHIIVRPEDTWVLGDYGDDRITLTACHPKRSAAKRIIVAAELISEPVASPPPPEDYITQTDLELSSEQVDAAEATGLRRDAVDVQDFGGFDPTVGSATPFDRSVFADEVSLDEGLDGDEGAIVPAILWGLAAVAAYLAFKQLGRRWMFWPSLVLGFVPVVFFMALSFEHIDRFLPAG